MRRQQILDRDNPPFALGLIDAGVLRRKVGESEVMCEKLDHLLEASGRPTVSVQIVGPECLPGLAGAFMIAEPPGGQPITIHADLPVQGDVTNDCEFAASVQERYEVIRLWVYLERISLKMIEEARRERT